MRLGVILFALGTAGTLIAITAGPALSAVRTFGARAVTLALPLHTLLALMTVAARLPVGALASLGARRTRRFSRRGRGSGFGSGRG